LEEVSIGRHVKGYLLDAKIVQGLLPIIAALQGIKAASAGIDITYSCKKVCHTFLKKKPLGIGYSLTNHRYVNPSHASTYGSSSRMGKDWKD